MSFEDRRPLRSMGWAWVVWRLAAPWVAVAILAAAVYLFLSH